MKPSRVILRDIGKVFSTEHGSLEAIQQINFEVSPGEVVSLVGPSGCGKTTLLKIVAGLVPPTSGVITTNPTGITPMLILQEYGRGLLPFKTVASNVGIALLNHKLPTEQKDSRVLLALEQTGLSDAAALYPWQLSGGMQQRILLARCLTLEAPCVLFDEPFSSVDALTRYILEDEVRALSTRIDSAVIYVTHDIDSAVYCGDRVIVLSPAPAIIRAEITIDLGEHRTQAEARSSRNFAQLRSEIYDYLQSSP